MLCASCVNWCGTQLLWSKTRRWRERKGQLLQHLDTRHNTWTPDTTHGNHTCTYVHMYIVHVQTYSCVHRPTLSAWLILAPASNSVFTTSRYPYQLATYNGLQPFCNTIVIITRGWTCGGGCWNITLTDVTFLYKGRSKVEGKRTDEWEGRDRARGRKIGYTLNVTEGGYRRVELLPTTDRASRVLWTMRYCTSNLQFSL